MRLFFPLSGDDVFISYSRRDGALYAAGLADKLTEKKLSCFIDKLGTEPNHDLPPSLKKKIKNCTVFVLVGTEKAAQSEFVKKEIAEFKQTGRTILPIDFGGNVANAIWYEEIPGLAVETEKDAEALETGNPSQNVTNFVEKSFNYTRRNQFMSRMFWGALSLFFILIGLSVGSYVFAQNKVDIATKNAIEQETRAQKATEKADAETLKANNAEQIAIEQENNAKKQGEIAKAKEIEAKNATKLANNAKKLADEKNKLAIAKTKIAEEATNLANEQTQKAKLAENRKVLAEKETKKQELIAASRQLAIESKSASDKTQSAVNVGSYDPQRSVLLAIESLKILRTPQGMQSLQDAIMNLTDQAYNFEFNEGEGYLSVSPNAKFLGIIQGDKSYLRSIKSYKFDESEYTNKKQMGFSDQQISESPVDNLIFSGNSQRFAIVTNNEAIVRDTKTFDRLKSFVLPEKHDNISLNNDGTSLIFNDKPIPERCQSNSNCVLSSNREWMATLDDSNVIKIINSKTKKPVGIPQKIKDEPSKFALSNDGKLLAIANGRNTSENVVIYKTDGWINIGHFPVEWNLEAINFTSDSQWLTAVTARVPLDGGGDLGAAFLPGSVIRVWDIKKTQLVMETSLAREGGILGVDFFAGNRIFVTRTIIYSDYYSNPKATLNDANKERVNIWILIPDDLIKLGCSLLSRNLSNSEWLKFIGDRGTQTRETCKGLSIPEDY